MIIDWWILLSPRFCIVLQYINKRGALEPCKQPSDPDLCRPSSLISTTHIDRTLGIIFSWESHVWRRMGSAFIHFQVFWSGPPKHLEYLYVKLWSVTFAWQRNEFSEERYKVAPTSVMRHGETRNRVWTKHNHVATAKARFKSRECCAPRLNPALCKYYNAQEGTANCVEPYHWACILGPANASVESKSRTS